MNEDNIERRTSNPEPLNREATASSTVQGSKFKSSRLLECLSVGAFLAVATLCIFHTPEARGDLTARVYPGYTFVAGQRVTVDQLNRAATPTIVIVGTLDGTNVGLSAGSVNLTMLAADIYDNVTIDTTNGTSFRVKPSGIRNLQLYTNMFDGSSAIDPGGTTIRVNPDWNFLAISNNTLTIRTQIVAAALDNLMTNLQPSQIQLDTSAVIVGDANARGTAVSVGTLLNNSANTYSNSAAIPSAGGTAPFSHGMGSNPSWVRVTVRCTSADNGYASGDEVEAYSVLATGTEAAFSVYDSGGTLKVLRNNGAEIKMLSVSGTAGSQVNMDESKWVVVARVRP